MTQLFRSSLSQFEFSNLGWIAYRCSLEVSLVLDFCDQQRPDKEHSRL